MHNLKHSETAFSVNGTESAPPLVLIHGVGLNASMWRYQVETLQKNFRVITYDLLGHGSSENPPGERTLDDFIQQLLSLIDHLGYEKINLAGFSIGGMISTVFAAKHCYRLERLVIMNAVYNRSDKQRAAVQERHAQVLNEGPTANVEDALTRWFSESYRHDNPQLMDNIRTIFKDHMHDGYAKAYAMFAYADDTFTGFDLTQITCPTLVMTGDGDVGSTPEMSENLAAAIPNACCTIIPNAKHGAPMENAHEVNAALLQFLSGNKT